MNLKHTKAVYCTILWPALTTTIGLVQLNLGCTSHTVAHTHTLSALSCSKTHPAILSESHPNSPEVPKCCCYFYSHSLSLLHLSWCFTTCLNVVCACHYATLPTPDETRLQQHARCGRKKWHHAWKAKSIHVKCSHMLQENNYQRDLTLLLFCDGWRWFNMTCDFTPLQKTWQGWFLCKFRSRWGRVRTCSPDCWLHNYKECIISTGFFSAFDSTDTKTQSHLFSFFACIICSVWHRSGFSHLSHTNISVPILWQIPLGAPIFYRDPTGILKNCQLSTFGKQLSWLCLQVKKISKTPTAH